MDETRPRARSRARSRSVPGARAAPGRLPLSPPPEEPPVPVLFLVSTILFPGGTAQAQLRTPRNLRQLDLHPDPDSLFVFAFAPGADPETVEPSALAPVGVLGRVVSRIRLPDGSFQIAMQGLRRVGIRRWTAVEPVLEAEVAEAAEDPGSDGAVNGHILDILNEIELLVRLDDAYTMELHQLLRSNVEEPGRFADLVALTVSFDQKERLFVLRELAVERRLGIVVRLLREKIEVARIAREIEQRANVDISEAQREYLLRQQMKAIRSELGEQSREEADALRYTGKADEAALPAEIDRAVRAEIDRLRLTNPASAEYGILLQYLDWVFALPWKAESEDRLDLARVRRALDEDHHGLEKPKKRILEYLSVRAIAPDAPGPILCFVGPPGTGKTSLAQSIARAMGRRLARFSVGGVHDEAQIRGHRRTYVGAMPGRILQTLRRAGTRNPVIVIDEIDKMSAGPQGDPAAALLEVLDPEQNPAFTDHYLDLPFDLSRVLFVATANSAYEIPDALLDRMEVVELNGYTAQEKVEIARRHLVPRALRRTGTAGKVRIPVAVLRSIVAHYTLESGVRDLSRRLEEICRKYAVEIARGRKGPFRPRAKDLGKLLGRPPVRDPERRHRAEVGVVTGLAWTGYGGDLLVIEGIRMPGGGGFQVTGSLGDVMKESVQAAGSWVRSHAGPLGIKPEEFAGSDVHIHFPEGAVPKDGPSAGVAVVTVLASVFTGRRVRHDIAMTGEVTLRGKVLPVGGLQEKLAAAQRARIREVLVPKANLDDVADVPAEIRRSLKIRGIETVEEALKAALVRSGR